MTHQPEESRLAFLQLHRLPARLNAEEAGWVLGFSSEEISILTAKGLLKTLGTPTAKGRKWYASVSLIPLGGDITWLTKSSLHIAAHWRHKNAKAPRPS